MNIKTKAAHLITSFGYAFLKKADKACAFSVEDNTHTLSAVFVFTITENAIQYRFSYLSFCFAKVLRANAIQYCSAPLSLAGRSLPAKPYCVM